MAAVAHGWKPPKSSGIDIPRSVAKEFNRADQRAHKAEGGLMQLLKSLPRGKRFDELTRRPIKNVSGENAILAQLASEASPLQFYGGMPDMGKGRQMGFGLRDPARRKFMSFDTSRANPEGHATQVGQHVMLMNDQFIPKAWVDIEIEKALRGQGYGREALAVALSGMKGEGERFPLYDVQNKAKPIWEAMGAKRVNPNVPFRQRDKAAFDAESGMRDVKRSVARNNDYFITPEDFLSSFAGGGSVSGPLAKVMRTMPRPLPQTKRVLEEMFERIPGVENLIEPEALGSAASRAARGEGLPMVYRPEAFEKLASPLVEPGQQLTPGGYHTENIKRLRGLLREDIPFSDMPFLTMRPIPQTAETRGAQLVTTGHEGRHRSRALVESGYPVSLMNVSSEYNRNMDALREKFHDAHPLMRMLNQKAQYKVTPIERKLKGMSESDEEVAQAIRDLQAHPEWFSHYSDVFVGNPITGRQQGGRVSPLKQMQRKGPQTEGDMRRYGSPKQKGPQSQLDRAQMMARQIVRQQSLQDPKQKLTGFARGGNVHRQRIPRRGVHGYQGGGIIKSPLAMMKQGINMVARPWQRSFAKPVMGAEASVSGTTSPVDMPQRYAQARQGLQGKSPLADLPYEQGVGAWQGESGLQTNPLFMTEMPRTLGRVSDEGESLKYAGAMGKSLNQFGVPVSRATKSVFNIPEGADSVILSGVKDDDIPRLAEAVGQDAVVAQRPKGEVLIFSLTGEPINEVAKKVKLVVPNAKLNFGVSKPDVDRVLVAKEKMGPGTKTYDEVGAEDLLRASEEDVAGSMEGAM